jgi:transcriptional regulator of acetoin/glycerol metabolism
MLPPQRPKDFDAALREARRFLLARGEVPSDALVGAVVARSWARSHAAGLSPDAHPPEFFHLAGLALAEAIDDRQMLLAHARPVMEYLHAQTRDSGSMVILADDHGVLLESLGDAEFLDRAGRVALAPGASWHERDRGTNAIGTALAEASAVVINGAEHFLDRNDFLTCAAAPVSAPDGRLLGVLDISGDHRRRHPHTLSLVHTAAQMLENRIFEVSHRGDIRLHLHPLAEGVGTVAEGAFGRVRGRPRFGRESGSPGAAGAATARAGHAAARASAARAVARIARVGAPARRRARTREPGGRYGAPEPVRSVRARVACPRRGP